MSSKIRSLTSNAVLILVSLALVFALVEAVLRAMFPDGYFYYQPVEGIHATSEFKYHTARNSWGVRDREFTREELARKKIILLGDSMTYGQGVELEDTFPKRIEHSLSGVSPDVLVINGGGKGTSTLGQFESVKELMKKNKFDAVGFCFFLGNDSDNNLDDTRAGAEIERVDVVANNYFSARKWVFKRSIAYNYFYFNLKVLAYNLDLIPSFSGQDLLRKEYADRGRKGWEATYSIIKDIKTYFDGIEDTQLFFVLLPQDFQVDPEKQNKYGLDQTSYDFLKPNRLISEFLEENDLPYLDVTQAFIEYYAGSPEEKLYFPIDRHFTELGHEVVTTSLTSYLLENVLQQ